MADMPTVKNLSVFEDLIGLNVVHQIKLLEKIPADQEIRPGLTAAEALHNQRALLSSVAPPPEECRLQSDLLYGKVGSTNLVLHLYSHKSELTRPGVIFIHGGGWTVGHHVMMSEVASKVAAGGFVTATIGYRLSGEASWPAPLEDAKCAVRWMRAHAEKIGVDPTRIAVVGESAGGHIASMVALTPGRWEGNGGWENESSQVQLATLYSPALDIQKLLHVGRSSGANPSRTERTYSRLSRYFGNADKIFNASPINNITKDCPPIMTLVGDQDHSALLEAAKSFHKKLDSVKVPNELRILPQRGHTLTKEDPDICAEHFVSFFLRSLRTL